eukprot:scaffold36494_cov40-Prasinocladus_malaysianus.AAC.1
MQGTCLSHRLKVTASPCGRAEKAGEQRARLFSADSPTKEEDRRCMVAKMYELKITSTTTQQTKPETLLQKNQATPTVRYSYLPQRLRGVRFVLTSVAEMSGVRTRDSGRGVKKPVWDRTVRLPQDSAPCRYSCEYEHMIRDFQRVRVLLPTYLQSSEKNRYE